MNTKYVKGQFVRNIATVLVAIIAGAFWACSNEESTLGGGVSEETRVTALNNITIAGKAMMLTGLGQSDSTDDMMSHAEQGGNVTVYELDSVTFEKTGVEFSSEVFDDGSFEIKKASFSSPYAFVHVVYNAENNCVNGLGYCKNTFAYSVMDLRKNKNINVNVLTTLSSKRIMQLAAKGMDFDLAQKQAEREILEAFAIYDTHKPFDEIGSSMEKDNDYAVFVMMNFLLAASYQLDDIVDDFAEDGLWNDVYEYCAEDCWFAYFSYVPTDEVADKYYSARKNAASLAGSAVVFASLYDEPTLKTLKLKSSNIAFLEIVDSYLSNFNVVVGYSVDKCDESLQGEISKVPFIPVKCDKGLWVIEPELPHEIGTMIDSRDGKQYKITTFKINGVEQTWMAENLKFSGDSLKGETFCYDDDLKNCETDGVLYSLNAALNTSDRFETIFEKGDSYNSQGICPSGWRLPSKDDWENLIKDSVGFGVDNEIWDAYWPVARLWSKSWIDGRSVSYRGFDSYGLDIRPIGKCSLFDSAEVSGDLYNEILGELTCSGINDYTSFLAYPASEMFFSSRQRKAYYVKSLYGRPSESLFVRCIKND